MKFRRPNRQRVYIIPTVWGLFLILMLLGLTLFGVWSNSPALVTMGLLFAVLTLISTVQTNQNLLDITIDATRSEGVAVGKVATIKVILHNQSADDRHALEVELKLANELGKHRQVCSEIKAGGRAIVEIPLPTTKRGVYPVERVTVQSRFPLGIFVAWRWQATNFDIVVFPRPQGNALSSDFIEEQQAQQTTPSAQHLGSGDYSGHRDYQDGDSHRHIDWKAHARGRPLLVKMFSDHHSAAHKFRFSQTPQRDNEARLEQLSKWVGDAAAKDAAFALELPDSTLAMGRGHVHLERARELLARCQVDIDHAS